MPYPRWLAKINKRLFNPRTVRLGLKPVVVHLGRRTGKPYETPIDAYPTTSGYVLVVRYGPGSDWVRNILAAGRITLRIAGDEHPLESPRLVARGDAIAHLEPGYQPPADFHRAEHYLLMDRTNATR